MKQIKLKSLTLNGYRGQNSHIDFSENTTEIHARNGVGKSSIFDAYCQLLTRADSRNRTDYEMFDNTHKYTNDDNPKSEIIGVFNIDGYDVEIKQTASIKFVRNKETGEYERGSGIKYSLMIDDVERSATDYVNWIEANFAPIEKLKNIANIYHFTQNIPKWETQRKMLSEISGGVDADDFKTDFSELLKHLERLTITDLKQQTNNKINPLKKKIGRGETLGELQIQINTLQQALPDISGLSKAVERRDIIDAEIKQLNEQKANLQEPIQKALQEQSEHAKLVSKAKSNYSEAESIYNSEFNAEILKLKGELAEINSYNDNISFKNEQEAQIHKNMVSYLDGKIKQFENNVKKREELLKQRDKNKALEFQNDSCSFCGQELPYELLEEAKSKFNTQKEERNKDIVTEGKKLKVLQDALVIEIEDLKAKCEVVPLVHELKSKDSLLQQIQDYKDGFTQFEETDEAMKLKEKIEQLESSYPILPTVDTSELDSRIESLDDERITCIETIAVEKEYNKQVATIENLKIELKQSAQALSDLERLADMIRSYEREYAEVIKNKTSSLFKRVTIEMLKENKSGDMVDTCDILYKGVSSKTFNNAEKSLSGADIALAFMNAYGVKVPLFIDNAESINNDAYWFEDVQVVKLIVSQDDYKIKVELK